MNNFRKMVERRKSWLALAAVFALGGTPMAGHTEELLELFTSQGCSSCPPADAAITDYVKRDNLVVLSYHVDYWDYLGWKDTLGSPAFSDRQRLYDRGSVHGTVYTPQLVINGRSHNIGYPARRVESTIRDNPIGHSGESVKITAKLDTEKKQVDIVVSKPPAIEDGKIVLELVSFLRETDVEIKRGENAGRKITYRNVVDGVKVIGHLDPEGVSFSLPLGDDLPANKGLALIVRRDHQGILGESLGAAYIF